MTAAQTLATQWQDALEPPEYKTGLPIIGIPKKMGEGPYEFMLEAHKIMGDTFSFRVFNKTFVCNVQADVHKQYFEETDKRLSMKPAYYFLENMFGEDAIVFAPYDEYVRQRNLINPLFKGTALKWYLQAMTEQTKKLMDRMGDNYVAEEWTRVLGPSVMDIAAQAFLGRDFQQRMGSRFFELFLGMTGLIDFITPLWLPIPRFIKGKKSRDELNALVEEWMAERRKNPLPEVDFFQNMIDAKYPDGTPVPDHRIRQLIVLLIWAGHETTTGQMSWLLYDLIKNPDYLRMCQEQVDAVLGDSDGSDMTWEQANSLSFLEMAAKEAERLHPTAFIQMREATEDFVMGGYRIRKGNIVVLNPGIVGRHEQFFPQADVYNPMRFMRIETASPAACPEGASPKSTTCPFTGLNLETFQNIAIPESFKLMGFGGGIHRCPGINFARTEMRVVMAMLLKKYNIEVLSNPGPSMLGMAYWPMNFTVKLTKRAR